MRNVYVNRKDIANGIRRCPDACPLALALNRKFPGHITNVGAILIKLYNPETKIEKVSILHPEARRWIKDYDNGKKVQCTHVTINFKE